ncbi:hypothetical protein HUT06_36110 [Actinomadura sp. NAK00032]|uniref:hypothetical protein n=1 Tax=Actinomadura sp. NAK00032 TaxID=2742128 RepID=UPI001591B232|nr:hypothetical protein [Actinomadura sp. NAK00032]QKW38779.1 hypothetical protein HUT06_36110 [Actinomadura sp. NAK00032]
MKKTNALVATGALGLTLAGGAVVAGLTSEPAKPASPVAGTGTQSFSGGSLPGRSLSQQSAAKVVKKSDYGPWSSHFANARLKCRTYASSGTSGGRVWHYGKIECNKKVALIDVYSGINWGRPEVSRKVCKYTKTCAVEGWVKNPSGKQSWSVTTTGSVGVLLLSGNRLSAHVTFRA